MASSPMPPLSPCSNSPVGDQSDDASAVCTDDDENTLRRVMQSFGAKLDDFNYAGHGNDSESCSDDENSASDDIAYLRRLQEQFLPFSSVPAVSSTPETPPIAKPIRALPPSETDDEEDFETLRAIQRKFAFYGRGATLKNFSTETSNTVSVETSEEDPHNLSSILMINDELQEQSCVGLHKAKVEVNKLSVFAKKFIDAPIVVPSDTSLRNITMNEEYQEHNHINFNEEDGFSSLSVQQFITSKFPKSVQNFVDALKKNRSCQRFIRHKLLEIEAKMEVNIKLKERIKCLIDFHTAYRRKLGNSLCQKRDPRVRLISLRKQRPSSTNKENSTINSALFYSPEENPQMPNYKMVMRRFPVSLRERQWSNTEKDGLLNGVKQQYQEMLFLNFMNNGSDFDVSFDSFIMSTIGSANQVTPEILRSFIPLVNWDRLASIYLQRRSGSSCESRWLNHEDPMINHSPWTLLEDKKLLFTVQEKGLYNWIDLAVTLGTNRTPFQCLVRYQRSLNPHILNREWTSEEDAKLYVGVETFGDNNWQLVASHLDGRTSNQCSVRWRNSLLPERKRVGRWSVEEDKHLKVSVILFGAKNWKKIAQFVPGRTQSQCRERWLNCLDPSLNLERWTEEEDSKLLAAIAEHGHSWSKVAAHLPGRTDNHCRRRWKLLLPDEVPKLKAAQKLKKTVLISNFVGRESERSSLGPNDFTPIICLPAPNIENCVKASKRLSREQSNPTNKKRTPSCANKLKKARKKFKRSADEKLTESSVITSMIDPFGNLSLVSCESSDAIDTSCFKRKRKRSLSIMPKANLRGIEENTIVGAVNTNARVASSDLVCIPSINYDAAQSRSSIKRIKNLARNKQSRKSRAKTKGDVKENSSVGGLVITAETVSHTISENTCIKRTRKRTLRNKQSRKSEAKTKGGGEENSSVDGLVITAEATHFDLPLVTFTPDVSDIACIKRTRKRSSRNKKSQDKTKGDGEENSSVGGLVITVEAAHFDLPLLTVPPSVS